MVGKTTDGSFIFDSSVAFPHGMKIKEFTLLNGKQVIVVGIDKTGKNSFLDKPLKLTIDGPSISKIDEEGNKVPLGKEVYLIVEEGTKQRGFQLAAVDTEDTAELQQEPEHTDPLSSKLKYANCWSTDGIKYFAMPRKCEQCDPSQDTESLGEKGYQ